MAHLLVIHRRLCSPPPLPRNLKLFHPCLKSHAVNLVSMIRDPGSFGMRERQATQYPRSPPPSKEPGTQERRLLSRKVKLAQLSRHEKLQRYGWREGAAVSCLPSSPKEPHNLAGAESERGKWYSCTLILDHSMEATINKAETNLFPPLPPFLLTTPATVDVSSISS